VHALDPSELAARQLLWASIDPWIHTADATKFDRTLEPLAVFNPSVILSTHLPPAIGCTNDFLTTARTAPTIDPFVGPDQHALEAMLQHFEPASS
jgi:hypothetical protein